MYSAHTVCEAQDFGKIVYENFLLQQPRQGAQGGQGFPFGAEPASDQGTPSSGAAGRPFRLYQNRYQISSQGMLRTTVFLAILE